MDSSVLAIIEQDDKSHGSESRRRADAKKDRATVNAPDSLLTPDKPLSLRVVWTRWSSNRECPPLGGLTKTMQPLCLVRRRIELTSLRVIAAMSARRVRSVPMRSD